MSIQTDATNLLSGIPFGQLIGAPLIAAVDAQGMAAMETVNFIQAVGFTTTGSGNTASSSPQMITFTYSKTSSGAQTNFTLTVPLLTIVPIPFLRITTMTIDFTANIQADSSSTVSDTNTTTMAASLQASASYYLLASVKLNASISNTNTSNSTANSVYNVQYTMAIHVEAAQDSMPAGLQAMLNILTNVITPTSH
ncbi:MAG TPA: DUF2589 domain-containing protein [Opitutaceae bacterium]|jgi:hypothetical protein|nr:DUF2589 domain-containing protein [Opitutaceae bacterium]